MPNASATYNHGEIDGSTMPPPYATAVYKPEEIDRSAMARMITRAFQLWKLTTEDQLAMLGLSSGNRAALSRYRHGAPLSPSRDLLERAGHILAIHKSLRLLFPQDSDLAYAWMTQRNRAFDGESPVEVVGDRGFAGLMMVRAYLNRIRGN